MHNAIVFLRNLPRRMYSMRAPAFAIAFIALAMSVAAQAQPLSGTYTVGGTTPNYATIDAAITDLNTRGVSAPVIFSIRSGTYTPPAAGYLLNSVATMSATNTVTFKPAVGATVTIAGATNLGTAVFLLDGAKYFIFDGSNVVGGTSKDMTIRQQETTYNPAIWLRNDADLNVIKNLNLQGAGASQGNFSSSQGIGIVFIGVTTAVSGNDSNLVTNCVVGDPTGVYRCNVGVGCFGTSAKPNNGNKFTNLDIINYGNSGSAYGLVAYAEQAGTVVDGCSVHMTIAAPSGVSTMYGLYTDYSPGYPINSVFNGNKIYKLTSAAANWTVYGIYHWVSTATANSTITNNMISLGEDGDHTYYGIYFATSTGTINFYHNTINLSGNETGTRISYALYKSSSSALNVRNSIFNNVRTGTAYGMYVSSTTTWSSNYNFVTTAGLSTSYVGYYTGARTALTDFRTASGGDANSVTGIVGFVSPSTGDLHVSPTVRTPVESGGTPLASVTTDFDGQSRNLATPDIGADEGTFLPLLPNDFMAVQLTTPAAGSLTRAATLFSPVAVVANSGQNVQNNVNVRYRILNSVNAVVYNDIQTITTLASGSKQVVTFNQTGNQSGTSSLAAGTYTIEVTTQLAGDGDASNDVLTGTITVKAALSGTYTINKLGAGATNYTSFTSAINDLNFLGISGSVNFLIASGTYDATTETFPLTLANAASMTATNTVTFKPASGATVTLDATSAGALIDLSGAHNFIFDGSNANGGTTKNMTVINRSTGAPTVRFINGGSSNLLKNMILEGSATSSTIGIVNIAGGAANSNNTILNNTIGDPTGTIRSVAAVYMTGLSTAMNTSNTFDGNDIVNFGVGSNTAYGFYVSTYNQLLKMIRNKIHISANGGITPSTLYAVYYSNSSSLNDTFALNQIYSLNTALTTTTQYGFYDWITSSSPVWLYNNMISLVANDGSLYGIYNTEPYTLYIDHNSIYIGGTSTSSSTSYAIGSTSGATIYLRDNILANYRVSTGSNSNLDIYVSSAGTMTSNYNSFYSGGTSTAIGYWVGTYYSTLPTWAAGTGKDANSVFTPVTFTDPVNGDLHVNPQPIFRGEGVGTNVGILADFDGQTRDLLAVDMGADDGDFNGGGLTVISPNGGEKFSVDYSLDITFSANRIMNVRADFSTDGGSTWTTKGAMTTVKGTNVLNITTPSNITSTARVRVMSAKNIWEGDSSDANFSLVLPVFTMMSPNGGEVLVPTDTLKAQWISQFVPPAMRLQFDYSTNNGSTWVTVDNTITNTVNSPLTNTFNFIVPNAPTTQGLARIKVYGGTINDVSDASFTILPQPFVKLSPLNLTEYTGYVETIRWTSQTTDYVKLEYSTDAGITWLNVVPNGTPVPAYLGQYPWTIPATASPSMRLRITNVERPRFRDSIGGLSIVKPTVQVISPNGGEKYDLSQPVAVTWNAQNVTTLRLDYSSDNGSTWQAINSTIPAGVGSYIFTPVAIPTKLALVRLTDIDHPQTFDQSDRSFELMPSKSITVYAPAAGDRIVRSTTTQIIWDAPRVSRVNIQLSTNNGANWQTLASNVLASEGSYNWLAPNQAVQQAKVRIVDAGDITLFGESGTFSVVDPIVTVPTLRVIAPNGGEKFTEGDIVSVRWISSSVSSVSVAISADSGATWTTVAQTVPASLGLYKWTAPANPGPNYLVRVFSGSPAIADQSDAVFEVTRKLRPAMTVLRPNGGESLYIDSTEQIRWSATDITGNVTIEYSTNGKKWNTIATVPSTPSNFAWKVP
ncbi:MAG: hypothetical protein JWQ98_1345, partial [Chlorobi bacterium]|nr:hypothetical protein [Chlorobiota bacterium]